MLHRMHERIDEFFLNVEEIRREQKEQNVMCAQLEKKLAMVDTIVSAIINVWIVGTIIKSLLSTKYLLLKSYLY